jgi:short-subunit dehydrogenase
LKNTRPLALITGASSGIGAVFASALAARGYDLVLVARRKDRLQELARSLAARGIVAEPLEADLANDDGIAVVEQRIHAAQNLDLLVNNAGFGTRGKFFSADVESQDHMHRLHVLATVRLTHAALQGMVERAHGGVINVSSVAAYRRAPGSVSYCATKCWMNAFTEGLALELKAAGSPVKVQALCPGYTLTEFHDAAGIERNKIAAPLWLSAEKVVAASLAGLDRGKLIVIPGWQYKAAAFLLRHMPQRLLDSFAVRESGERSRD